MKITRAFIKNFAHPYGVVGRVVAWRLDITNRQANEWTLSLLDIQSPDRVLEVGFGSGRTLKITAGKLTSGFVAGVDPSATMLKLAQKNNATAIASGRMELRLGDMEALPYENDCFDKVYAVQVINYLADPLKGLKELYRVTRPGGRVALFFEGKDKFDRIQSLIEGIYHPFDDEEVIAMLQEAGFPRAWCETRDFTARTVHYRGHVALGEKEMTTPSENADLQQGTTYVFEVEGPLTEDWSEWLEGMAITNHKNGVTNMSGRVADQAALHGLLAKIRDLNLRLISCKQLEPTTPKKLDRCEVDG